MATPRSSSKSAGGSTSAKSGSSSKSSRANGSSATSKTGSSKKSAASKSSATSKTGASRSAGTAKKSGSKAGAAKSATASRSGGSKTSTATKSGGAGKRTASGGAKGSAGGRKTAGAAKQSAGNGKAKSTGNGSTSRTKKASGGIVKAVTDAVTGLFSPAKPNAIDILTADHRVVDGYFHKVKEHEDANHTKTYKNIQFELDAHAHIEETIFYPYLLKHGNKDLKKIVREGIEEHRQMKLFLAELDELAGDNERFKAKLKVLMEDTEHHVDEEEDEMFPMVEDQIPREVLEKLGTQMETEKARFQKRTAPAKTKRAAASR